MQRKQVGEPAVVRRAWAAGGDLDSIDREHHDHEIRGERSRSAEVETGLPFVVVAALIVAIVKSHGVVIVCQMGVKCHRESDGGALMTR